MVWLILVIILGTLVVFAREQTMAIALKERNCG